VCYHGKVTIPCDSWCLDGSLKPLHHDLRSRLLGGEAALACAVCCDGAMLLLCEEEVMVTPGSRGPRVAGYLLRLAQVGFVERDRERPRGR
jgi:hypothetical protein